MKYSDYVGKSCKELVALNEPLIKKAVKKVQETVSYTFTNSAFNRLYHEGHPIYLKDTDDKNTWKEYVIINNIIDDEGAQGSIFLSGIAVIKWTNDKDDDPENGEHYTIRELNIDIDYVNNYATDFVIATKEEFEQAYKEALESIENRKNNYKISKSPELAETQG